VPAPPPHAGFGGEEARSIDARLEQVELLRRQGDAAGALALCEELVQGADDPALQARAWQTLAELSFAVGEYERTVREANRLLAAHPEWPERKEVLLLAGRAHEALGELQLAMGVYRRVGEEYPDEAEVMAARIRTLEEQQGEQVLQALGYL
jgi:tetratricopeptide (TPR) repeat protein